MSKHDSSDYDYFTWDSGLGPLEDDGERFYFLRCPCSICGQNVIISSELPLSNEGDNDDCAGVICENCARKIEGD